MKYIATVAGVVAKGGSRIAQAIDPRFENASALWHYNEIDGILRSTLTQVNGRNP